ncbi:MAG: hypothetical protein PHY42_05485 [Bacilli bacterium]|nr:hypothetical protein [Bacilli bacterium]
MKKSPTELMKEVKLLQGKKDDLLLFEQRNWTTSYLKGETPQENSYDYDATREQIHELDETIRSFKLLLAKANVEAIVEPFQMSICEALIYLAQLSQKKARLEMMGKIPNLERRNAMISNHDIIRIELTKACFDVIEVQKELEALNRTIVSLQIAIDRTNLTHMIEF